MAKLATLAQYKQLMNDRPLKFAPEDVDYREDEHEGYPCVSCIHWYQGIAMEHNVCEIMRPGDENVPWNWTCDFHTVDGQAFPKLKGEESK